MFIKILYAILVLSTIALVWAAMACYVRVKRHLAARHDATTIRKALDDAGVES